MFEQTVKDRRVADLLASVRSEIRRGGLSGLLTATYLDDRNVIRLSWPADSGSREEAVDYPADRAWSRTVIALVRSINRRPPKPAGKDV